MADRRNSPRPAQAAASARPDPDPPARRHPPLGRPPQGAGGRGGAERNAQARRGAQALRAQHRGVQRCGSAASTAPESTGCAWARACAMTEPLLPEPAVRPLLRQARRAPAAAADRRRAFGGALHRPCRRGMRLRGDHHRHRRELPEPVSGLRPGRGRARPRACREATGSSCCASSPRRNAGPWSFRSAASTSGCWRRRCGSAPRSACA